VRDIVTVNLTIWFLSLLEEEYMRRAIITASSVVLCSILSVVCEASDGASRTIIYDGKVNQVGAGLEPSRDLWLTLRDLTRVTGFVLKPKGMCKDKLCIPIPKARTNEFISKQGKMTWFNLSEFARLVRQPIAYDEKESTWLFGPRSDELGFITSLDAPDFALPDVNGRIHKLSQFRGKKVLLVTWASW
jgi:hypothetical protein